MKKNNKTKYVAKCEVWISISESSKYADGMGEAQREVRNLISQLEQNKDVLVSHATEIDIRPGKLKKFESECDTGLKFIDQNKKVLVLDDGGR